MGITEFKNILESQKPIQKRQFDHIIIDGSNLLITYLSVSSSELLERYGKNFVNGSNIDAIKQCAFIINNTVKLVTEHVSTLKNYFKTQSIHIVMDPITTPIYFIDNNDEYAREIIASENISEEPSMKITSEEPSAKTNDEESSAKTNDESSSMKTTSETTSENIDESSSSKTNDEESSAKTTNYFRCSLKESEQKRRRKYNDVDKYKSSLMDKIKVYFETEHPSIDYETISKILLSNSQLTFPHQILQLVQITLDELSDKIEIIRAGSEADLTIKCLAETLMKTTNESLMKDTNEEPSSVKNNDESLMKDISESSSMKKVEPLRGLPTFGGNPTGFRQVGNEILIMSRDSDYHILFADMENVYCSELSVKSNIYNPNQLWKFLLKENFSYDYVIRIAPILGNDYTVHNRIISASNFDDVLSFFNFNGNFNSLKRNGRKTVGKLVKLIPEVIEGIISPSMMDKLLYTYHRKFFDGYYKSVLIYSNWKIYDKMTNIKRRDDDNVNKLMTYINDFYLYDESALKDKDWKTLNISINKLNDEDKIEYFKECLLEDISDVFSEYGGEFV